MTPLQLDRWLLNNVFQRTRVRSVALSDCVDEFGRRFGQDGNHFFIRALASTTNRGALIEYLRRYYATHDIHAFATTMGLGPVYFCPWEHGRVRPLSKFAVSHKVGPTPDHCLAPIADRLLGVVTQLRFNGYRPRRRSNGIARVYVLVDAHGNRRYAIRDGQHRAAALSHLGHRHILVCTENDHWTPSPVYQALSHLRRRPQNGGPENLSEVRLADCLTWPHVASGRISAEHARNFFHHIFHASENTECFVD